MSVNARIKAALDPLGDPVSFGEFVPATGQAQPERYYTFNWTKLGADYGDNTPGHERYLCTATLVCPRTFDSVERVATTQMALFSAGFTWPDVTNASDADGQRIVFEFETAGGILWQP